ncbi:efflux transporter outer membrane subunit [Galbibacter mesophilus]|uniref:efflux transporter outer membrane subunit n=1 Tax=Galbibacter mesophilus TaxID=379069 RepID=UPI00191FC1C9|nr:efflux transporter outer membrane subunit [Galbibacter mesophilus]MCM5661378.1 efflux transporter outer membrane subunit [Galbibacter mesophilus]
MGNLFQKFYRLYFTVAFLLLLNSCAVKKPPVEEDLYEAAFANFILPSTWQNSVDTTAINENWLSTFDDELLDTLVSEALIYNPDLRMSSARVEESQGYVQAAQAALRPALSILGRETNKLGGNLGGGLNGALFAASWELDIWGELRNARNAEESNLAASEAELSFARLSLAAQVARSYYLASETYLQIELAKQMIAISEKMRELSKKRFDVGIGTEIDFMVSEANLNRLKDALKQLELGYNNQLRALELLLGRYPSAEIEVKNALAEITTKIPTGIPVQVLERRPDVLAAQYRFNAAFYRVGEAEAAKLPNLNLTGGFGFIDSELMNLRSEFSNPIRSIGGELMAPIYQGGKLRANVVVRNAQQKQAVEMYSRTVLNALADVENALEEVETVDNREQFLAVAVSSNERAFELEQQRYRVGIADMRDLITQQMDLFRSEIDLLRLRGEKIVQRINLFVALGGSM